MNCHDMRRQMICILDETSDSPAYQAALEHCAGCADCQDALAALRDMLDTCREFVVFPGRAYPFAQLRARMVGIQPLEEIRRFLPRLRYYGPIPRYALALTMLALTAIAPGVLGNIRGAVGGAERTLGTRLACIEHHLDAMEAGRFDADLGATARTQGEQA